MLSPKRTFYKDKRNNSKLAVSNMKAYLSRAQSRHNSHGLRPKRQPKSYARKDRHGSGGRGGGVGRRSKSLLKSLTDTASQQDIERAMVSLSKMNGTSFIGFLLYPLSFLSGITCMYMYITHTHIIFRSSDHQSHTWLSNGVFMFSFVFSVCMCAVCYSLYNIWRYSCVTCILYLHRNLYICI